MEQAIAHDKKLIDDCRLLAEKERDVLQSQASELRLVILSYEERRDVLDGKIDQTRKKPSG